MPIRGLALETSGRNGSIALLEDGVMVGENAFPHGLQNAAMLLPLIAEMLKSRDLAPDQIDELYVSTGPGSFTGLRIAITLAKTWWLTNGTPVVSVPSVRAIVENAPPTIPHAAVILDAKRNQVFTATYSRDAAGVWQETLPARVDTIAGVLEKECDPFKKGSHSFFIIGEGLDHHAVPGDVEIAPKELWAARAEVVGRLGYAAARRGEFADVMTLTPTYIRLPEAEEKWQKEHASK